LFDGVLSQCQYEFAERFPEAGPRGTIRGEREWVLRLRVRTRDRKKRKILWLSCGLGGSEGDRERVSRDNGVDWSFVLLRVSRGLGLSSVKLEMERLGGERERSSEEGRDVVEVTDDHAVPPGFCRAAAAWV